MSAVMQEPKTYVQGIPSGLVGRFWAFAEPYIKRALDHAAGELKPDDLKRLCMAQDAQLWLISRESRIVGAVTTEIVSYPNRKHCRIITLAGNDFESWIPLADEVLEPWARTQGCDAIEALVRKGFVPKLAPIGYRHKYSVVLKELQK